MTKRAEWELISSKNDSKPLSGFLITTQRLWVPDGWLIKTTTFIRKWFLIAHSEAMVGYHDPEHKWQVE